MNYCTAGTSSKGCTPQISASGCPSATASTGFTLLAAGTDGAKPGLFLFTTSGRQATPWGSGNSLLCLASPVRRASLLLGFGTPGLCDGSLGEDLNALWCPTCPSPEKNPGVGTLVGAQFWSRTPPTGTGPNLILSDAIEFVVAP